MTSCAWGTATPPIKRGYLTQVDRQRRRVTVETTHTGLLIIKITVIKLKVLHFNYLRTTTYWLSVHFIFIYPTLSSSLSFSLLYVYIPCILCLIPRATRTEITRSLFHIIKLYFHKSCSSVFINAC